MNTFRNKTGSHLSLFCCYLSETRQDESPIIWFVVQLCGFASVFGKNLLAHKITVLCHPDVSNNLVRDTFYLTDPGDEGSHSGEDCGSLWGVTPPPVHKTGHSLYVPLPVSALTVQGASRVALDRRLLIMQKWKCRFAF